MPERDKQKNLLTDDSTSTTDGLVISPNSENHNNSVATAASHLYAANRARFRWLYLLVSAIVITSLAMFSAFGGGPFLLTLLSSILSGVFGFISLCGIAFTSLKKCRPAKAALENAFSERGSRSQNHLATIVLQKLKCNSIAKSLIIPWIGFICTAFVGFVLGLDIPALAVAAVAFVCGISGIEFFNKGDDYDKKSTTLMQNDLTLPDISRPIKDSPRRQHSNVRLDTLTASTASPIHTLAYRRSIVSSSSSQADEQESKPEQPNDRRHSDTDISSKSDNGHRLSVGSCP